MLAQPPVRSSGTGQYTDRLVAAFPDELAVDVVELPVDGATPLPFLAAVFDDRLARADVVHVQFDYVLFGPFGLYALFCLPLLALRARLIGIPLVVTVHEALSGDEALPPLRPLKRLYLRLANVTVARAATRLVFLSTAARTRLTDHITIPTERILQLEHGVPEPRTALSKAEARRRLGVDTADPVVVAPGYVSPRKGSDVFVEAARRLPERSFVLAGGAPRAAHEDFASSLADRAPANCTVTGQLSEPAFHAAFVAADLVVLPHRETAQRGVRNPVSQSGVFNWAAAYGVPTLASDCPHFRALAAEWDAPALFKPGDPAALADEIQRLLTEDGRRTELGAVMESYRDANGIRSVAAAHLDLYRSVASA
jgi:glycosyltransferase involved in cell wall biosynthesis